MNARFALSMVAGMIVFHAWTPAFSGETVSGVTSLLEEMDIKQVRHPFGGTESHPVFQRAEARTPKGTFVLTRSKLGKVFTMEDCRQVMQKALREDDIYISSDVMMNGKGFWTGYLQLPTGKVVQESTGCQKWDKDIPGQVVNVVSCGGDVYLITTAALLQYKGGSKPFTEVLNWWRDRQAYLDVRDIGAGDVFPVRNVVTYDGLVYYDPDRSKWQVVYRKNSNFQQILSISRIERHEDKAIITFPPPNQKSSVSTGADSQMQVAVDFREGRFIE